MAIETTGLHHVTAIGGDPQRNVDFYARALGLRLVKTTVNFDDPGTYHLYYGDQAGLHPVCPGLRGCIGDELTPSHRLPDL